MSAIPTLGTPVKPCWCGGRSDILYWEGEFTPRQISWVQLVKCENCHTVRTAVAEGTKLQKGDGVDGAYLHFEAASWDVVNAKRVLKYLQSGYVLDIGCNTGHLLRYLVDRGIQGIGIEPNARAVKFARDSGLDVMHGYFEEHHDWHNVFDGVVLSHVLEHITDPVKFLLDVSKLLRPGGFIFVFVPNINSLRTRFRIATWAPLNPQDHVWHFDKTSLKRLALASDLKTLHVDTGDLYDAYHDLSVKYLIRRTAYLLGLGEQLNAVLQKP